MNLRLVVPEFFWEAAEFFHEFPALLTMQKRLLSFFHENSGAEIHEFRVINLQKNRPS